MKLRLIKITIFLLGFSLYSCTDIFEQPIDDKTVLLISPGDSITVDQYTQTFRWDPVEYAIRYRLQIVSPDFNTVLDFVLDTIVTSTEFSYTLDPGTYQWKVRAENGSSETAYSTRTLIVDTAGLTNQTVLLSSPATAFNTNSTVLSFSWQPMYGATSYTIQADALTGNFSGTLLLDASTPYTLYSFDFASEGDYIWRVKAANSSQESNYSEIRTFTIDQTAPSVVTLTSPANSSVISRPVSLTWNASSSTDIKNYQLSAYKVVGTDSTLLSGFPQTVTGTSFSFNFGNVNDKIAWKVKAFDQAGNASDFSTSRGFTIGL